MIRFIIICLFLNLELQALTYSPEKVRTVYNSLDPLSISQHLAFYQLYPETNEGQKSLAVVWKLLSGEEQKTEWVSLSYPTIVQSIVSLVNKQSDQQIAELTDKDLMLIEEIASRLPNRQLKGHAALQESQVLALNAEEIDVARGLFLTQLGPANLKKIRTYEALIDLMALQIKARLTPQAKPDEIIRTINDFIFGELGFKFPPHSEYAKEIDVYTFLPSVLDSRKGVCLGVSILYICLAQRLNLKLEMITPPGHIYVRYRNGEHCINIETTARGIHIDSKEYLGIETRFLQLRNEKEVIGLAHFNQASVYWQKEHYAEALNSYQKAEPYLQGDMLLKELKSYALLLNDHDNEGKKTLKELKGHVPEHAVSGNTLGEDYLEGNVDKEGIKVIFASVDEDRASILKKKERIEKVLQSFPRFRSGWFALAVTWIQLHRLGEALDCLLKYYDLEKKDPEAEYYLTMLYAQRFDYKHAWEHFHQLEKILEARNHQPKLLKEIRRQLTLHSPE